MNGVLLVHLSLKSGCHRDLEIPNVSKIPNVEDVLWHCVVNLEDEDVLLPVN